MTDKSNELIEARRQELNISIANLAAKLGIHNDTLRKKLKGKRKWQREELVKVAQLINIPVESLLLGEEAKVFRPPTPIINFPSQYQEIPPDLRLEEYVFVPLVSGEIAAGTSGRVPENYVEQLICVFRPALGRRSIDELRAVTLAQDARSMEPALRPGDVVIIDPLDKPPFKPLPKKGGKNIYAVNLDEEGHCALKRVIEADDHWILISDNPDYDPIILHKSAENPFIGRVIWSWTSWV